MDLMYEYMKMVQWTSKHTLHLNKMILVDYRPFIEYNYARTSINIKRIIDRALCDYLENILLPREGVHAIMYYLQGVSFNFHESPNAVAVGDFIMEHPRAYSHINIERLMINYGKHNPERFVYFMCNEMQHIKYGNVNKYLRLYCICLYAGLRELCPKIKTYGLAYDPPFTLLLGEYLISLSVRKYINAIIEIKRDLIARDIMSAEVVESVFEMVFA